MKYKIIIGKYHPYFRMKRFLKKNFVDVESYLLGLLILVTIGIAIDAFFKMDKTSQFAVTTWFFFCTTVFIGLIKFERFKNNKKEME